MRSKYLQIKRKYNNWLKRLMNVEYIYKFNNNVWQPLRKSYYKFKRKKLGEFIITSLIWLIEILVITFIAISISFLIIKIDETEPQFLSSLNEIQKQIKIKQYHLDLSLIEQFGLYLKNLFNGELGISYSIAPEKPINDLLWSRMGISMILNLLAMAVSVVIGVFLAVILGRKPGGVVDGITSVGIAVVYATPGILLALYILIIGRAINVEYLFDKNEPETYILPVTSLSIAPIAAYIRLIRSELSIQLRSQHAKFAYLKGVSKTRFLFKHALKPAVFPIATFFPEALLTSFIGSFVVERIFSIPGTGNFLIEAIQTRDTNVVLIIFIITTALTVVGFRLRDILYQLVDPTIRSRQ